MTNREQSQVDQAKKILTTGARALLHWSDNEAAIFCIDELHNTWVCVGTPAQIIELIANKGR